MLWINVIMYYLETSIWKQSFLILWYSFCYSYFHPHVNRILWFVLKSPYKTRASLLTISCSYRLETNVWLLYLCQYNGQVRYTMCCSPRFWNERPLMIHTHSYLMLLPNRPHFYVKFIWNELKYKETIKKKSFFWVSSFFIIFICSFYYNTSYINIKIVTILR